MITEAITSDSELNSPQSVVVKGFSSSAFYHVALLVTSKSPLWILSQKEKKNPLWMLARISLPPRDDSFSFHGHGFNTLVRLYFELIGLITLQLSQVGDMLLQFIILEICHQDTSFPSLGSPAGYFFLVFPHIDVFTPLSIICYPVRA